MTKLVLAILAFTCFHSSCSVLSPDEDLEACDAKYSCPERKSLLQQSSRQHDPSQASLGTNPVPDVARSNKGIAAEVPQGNGMRITVRHDHEGMELNGKWEPPNGLGEGWSSQAQGVPLLHSKSRNGGIVGGGGGQRAISFITVTDSLFNTNLGTSYLWLHRDSLPHEWILLDNRAGHAICELYARAQRLATNDLLVFLHPDVILPDSWYGDFMGKLNMIESKDPNWGVLGTAGVPEGWPDNVPDGWAFGRAASSITDFSGTYRTGVDNLPVQALDESLLVIRRGSGPSFDAQQPGFDLYGTDIVLSARKLGMKSYLLNLRLLHKTVDVDGTPYNGTKWWSRNSPENMPRLHTTMSYLEQKWCNSSFLPSYALMFDLHQPAACD